MTTDQLNSIIVAHELGNEYFVWQMGDMDEMDLDERLEKFYQEQILGELDEDSEKVLALMEHTGDNWEDAESAIDSDYKVLTDEEADESLDERLEDYLDECILCNIDSAYHSYFDRDSWKSDNDSDRGSWLAPSEGIENEELFNQTTYYIYKQ